MKKLYGIFATGVASLTLASCDDDVDDSNVLSEGSYGTGYITENGDSLSQLSNDVIDFVKDNNIYVDAGNNLVNAENFLDTTLRDFEVYPDEWNDLFDTSETVITENDGEYYMNFVWVDNNRQVFTEDLLVSDVAKANKDLVSFIAKDDFNDSYSDFETIIANYDPIRVNIQDYVEALHIWLWTGGSGINIYDVEGGSYYRDNEGDLVFFNANSEYFNDGAYSFGTERKEYANYLIDNDFSLSFVKGTAWTWDYWDTHMHQNRTMLSSDGTDYYFQMYWADGTPEFESGICLTTDYGTEAKLLNEFYSQISEPSRFANY